MNKLAITINFFVNLQFRIKMHQGMKFPVSVKQFNYTL